MVQLNRGRRLVQGVQSSNIQVNVPSFNALENPINVLGEAITTNDRQAQLSYERELQTKKDQLSLLESDIKDINKASEALEAEWIAQEETRKDNSLTANVITLNELSHNLSLQYFDNPTEFENQMNEHYNAVIEKGGDWLDQTRQLKFAEKFQSIKNSNYKTIHKNYLNKLNDTTWAGIEAVKDHSIVQTNVLISNIENMDDLKTYFIEQESIMQFLTDRLGNYQTNVMGTQNKKNVIDLENIITEYVYERDKAFISHFLTEFVMAEPTKENVGMAQAVLQLYEQDRIPTADDIDKIMKRFPESTFSTKTIDDIIEVLRMNTERYSGDNLLTLKQRQDIISEADNAITKKYNEYVTNTIKENKLLEAEINNGIEQANATLTNLSANSYSRKQLEDIFRTFNEDTLTWDVDENAIEAFEIKQQNKNNFLELINERVSGLLSDKEFEKKAGAINFKELGLEGTPLQILKQYTVKTAFGNLDLNPASVTKDVFDINTMENNIELMNGLNVMKQEHIYPEEFLEFFKSARFFDMEDEVNQRHMVGMAIIKNYAFGKNSGGLDDDVNEALNNVYETWKSSEGNMGQSASQWAFRMHDKYSHVADNIEGWKEWYSGNNMENMVGVNISGYEWMENKTSWIFDKAVSREKWDDVLPWISLFDSVAWSGEWGGEREFDNLVKNKDTVGMIDFLRKNILGGMDYTGQNMSMETSVVNMMNQYVENNIYRYLHQQNMGPQDYERALETVFREGIKEISNNPDIAFSSILYVPNNANGYVVTDQNPQKLIMDGTMTESVIMQNANAFAGKFVLDLFYENSDEAAQIWFGRNIKAVTEEEWRDFNRTFMSLWQDKKIKLQPVSDTMDVGNPSWHIYIDPDKDGFWRPLTKDGIPVEWFPNAQFTDSSKGFTYEETIDKWADAIIAGEPVIKTEGWSTVYDFKDFGSEASSGTHWSDAFRMDIEELKDASPEEKTLFKNLLRKMIKGEEKWYNNLLLGSKWFDEKQINTATEMQSLLTANFNDFQMEIQKQMDFSFAKDKEIMLLQHNMRFHPEKFKGIENEQKLINISNQHNATMLDVYNDTFGMDNFGVIIPPNYAFVIKDIIASDDNWKDLIGEGTPFYNELKNQNFRFAKNKLMRLSYYFNELDRSAQHNAWLNIWNISYNR